MIHELRIYTLKPGKVPEFMKLAEERAMPIRGDNYGKLVGYWFSEFGPLNQIFHLWEFEDLNTRAELLNYWSVRASASYSPQAMSRSATRGGPMMVSPA